MEGRNKKIEGESERWKERDRERMGKERKGIKDRKRDRQTDKQTKASHICIEQSHRQAASRRLCEVTYINPSISFVCGLDDVFPQ